MDKIDFCEASDDTKRIAIQTSCRKTDKLSEPTFTMDCYANHDHFKYPIDTVLVVGLGREAVHRSSFSPPSHFAHSLVMQRK